MTTLHLRNSIGRSPLRLGLPRVQPTWIIRGFLLIPLALACLALPLTARAVSPAPDGGYPNGNTAEGDTALLSLTTGSWNTAIGTGALNHITSANSNTAVGNGGLLHATSGYQNTATGASSLQTNTTGYKNTADGYNTLLSNTSGNYNTADGAGALKFNTTANYNTADGYGALNVNTTGYGNVATGAGSLIKNTTGHLNIAVGPAAGQNQTTGSNNIDIANAGVAGEANTIRIGNQVAFTDVVGIAHPAQTKAFIAGISGSAVTGLTVVANSTGQIGVITSSRRFKDDIKPMDKASEAILALKPVTFRYKPEIDSQGIPQFGLVAEEVEKVNPDLVVRDEKGETYTVRYEAVNAMLLNEFLKEHRKNEEQEATITQLKATVAKQEATAAHQQKQIEALTAGLQKVSAQVEMSRRAPEMASSTR